jgi:hypothetical protein
VNLRAVTRLFSPRLLSVVLAALVVTAAAHATQVALVGDASVNTARPSTNFGALSNLYVGNGNKPEPPELLAHRASKVLSVQPAPRARLVQPAPRALPIQYSRFVIPQAIPMHLTLAIHLRQKVIAR